MAQIPIGARPLSRATAAAVVDRQALSEGGKEEDGTLATDGPESHNGHSVNLCPR